MHCERIAYKWLLQVKIRISCTLNAYGYIYPRWPLYLWSLLTLIEVSQRTLFHQIFRINDVFHYILQLDVSVIISSGITSLWVPVYWRTIAFSPHGRKAFTWWYGTPVGYIDRIDIYQPYGIIFRVVCARWYYYYAETAIPLHNSNEKWKIQIYMCYIPSQSWPEKHTQWIIKGFKHVSSIVRSEARRGHGDQSVYKALWCFESRARAAVARAAIFIVVRFSKCANGIMQIKNEIMNGNQGDHATTFAW